MNTSHLVTHVSEPTHKESSEAEKPLLIEYFKKIIEEKKLITKYKENCSQEKSSSKTVTNMERKILAKTIQTRKDHSNNMRKDCTPARISKLWEDVSQKYNTSSSQGNLHIKRRWKSLPQL